MRKELVHKRKTWSKTKGENERVEYTEYRKKYINHVKKTKKEHYNTVKNALSNTRDAQTLWKTYRMLTEQAAKPIPISGKKWENFLKLLHSTPPIQEISFSDCGQPYLDKNIEVYEVNGIISKTKANKTPGIDGINNNFYKV